MPRPRPPLWAESGMQGNTGVSATYRWAEPAFTLNGPMTHNGHPYRVDSYNCHDFKAEAPQRIKKERLVVAPCFNFIASIFCHHSPCFNFIAIIKYTKSQNPMQIVQRQTLESQQITRPQTLHVYTLQQTTHARPQQTAPHTYELVRTTTHNAIFQQNAPRKPNSCFGSSTNANTTNPKQMRNASPCRSYFRRETRRVQTAPDSPTHPTRRTRQLPSRRQRFCHNAHESGFDGMQSGGYRRTRF